MHTRILEMKVVRNLTAMAVVAGALTIAAQARADEIHFWLNQPECTGGCGAGTAPALLSNSSSDEVFVTLNSSTSATVEFVAPGSPGPTSIDTPVYINVSGTFSATTNLPGGVTGPGSEDHFGTMDLGTAANEGDVDVFLYLTATGSNSWLDAAAVLTPTTGYGAAYSHGFEAVVGGSQDAGYYSVTPLPAALPLFATGLGVMGLLGRRRKRKAQALAA
jgi:hypothetical protein